MADRELATCEPRPEVLGHLFHAADLRRRAGQVYISVWPRPFCHWHPERKERRKARLLSRAQKHENRARQLEIQWLSQHPLRASV